MLPGEILSAGHVSSGFGPVIDRSLLLVLVHDSALQPAPGVWNEDIFVGLDRCIAEMAKRGMRATMTVANEWQWSGGFAQYVR